MANIHQQNKNIRGEQYQPIDIGSHPIVVPDKLEPVDVSTDPVKIDISVSVWDLLTGYIQRYMEGVITSTDFKTTVSGFIAALAQLLGVLGIGIPAEVIGIVTAIAIFALGYWTNKKTVS